MSQASTIPGWGRDLGFGALAIITVTAASVLGQLATFPNLLPGTQGYQTIV